MVGAAAPWALGRKQKGQEWQQRPGYVENPLAVQDVARRTERPCEELELLTCAHLPTLRVHTAVAGWGVTKCLDSDTVGAMVEPGAQAAGPCCEMGRDTESGWGLPVAL